MPSSSFQVVANGRISFSHMAVYWICCIFFIHSSTDGRLGCIHILAIVNNVAINAGMQISFRYPIFISFWFPGGSDGKTSACNAGDLGSIPGLGRSPGEGNGNPLQHSCLENPMDRVAWWAAVQGVAESWTRLSDFTFMSDFTFTFTFIHSEVELLDHMVASLILFFDAQTFFFFWWGPIYLCFSFFGLCFWCHTHEIITI